MFLCGTVCKWLVYRYVPLCKNYDWKNMIDSNVVPPELWIMRRLCSQFMWQSQLILKG